MGSFDCPEVAFYSMVNGVKKVAFTRTTGDAMCFFVVKNYSFLQVVPRLARDMSYADVDAYVIAHAKGGNKIWKTNLQNYFLVIEQCSNQLCQ